MLTAHEEQSGKGAGATGKRGEKVFERFFERCALPRAGKLIDRTADQCGYDYGLESQGEPYWAIEVKTANDGPISITEPQWEKARLMGDDYWLVVVNEKLAGESEVMFLRNPARFLNPRKTIQITPVINYLVGAKALREALAQAGHHIDGAESDAVLLKSGGSN